MIHRRMIAALLLGICLFMAGCTNSENGNNGKTDGKPQTKDIPLEPGQDTDLQFSHLIMQFGPVKSGEVVRASYPFKNTTDGTVVIKQVVTSCECLKTEYPKGNIQPGQIGEIVANFETKGQSGTHEKIIAVVLENVQEPITLRLNGRIEK